MHSPKQIDGDACIFHDARSDRAVEAHGRLRCFASPRTTTDRRLSSGASLCAPKNPDRIGDSLFWRATPSRVATTGDEERSDQRVAPLAFREKDRRRSRSWLLMSRSGREFLPQCFDRRERDMAHDGHRAGAALVQCVLRRVPWRIAEIDQIHRRHSPLKKRCMIVRYRHRLAPEILAVSQMRGS